MGSAKQLNKRLVLTTKFGAVNGSNVSGSGRLLIYYLNGSFAPNFRHSRGRPKCRKADLGFTIFTTKQFGEANQNVQSPIARMLDA